jgi:hypothetical protein
MASPASSWDEEVPQNHRTRTGPNRLVLACGAMIQVIYDKVFGLTLEFRRVFVSKRNGFETQEAGRVPVAWVGV